MLEYVADVIQPDMVVWTGDSVPHDDRYNTLSEIEETMTVLTN